MRILMHNCMAARGPLIDAPSQPVPLALSVPASMEPLHTHATFRTVAVGNCSLVIVSNPSAAAQQFVAVKQLFTVLNPPCTYKRFNDVAAKKTNCSRIVGHDHPLLKMYKQLGVVQKRARNLVVISLASARRVAKSWPNMEQKLASLQDALVAMPQPAPPPPPPPQHQPPQQAPLPAQQVQQQPAQQVQQLAAHAVAQYQPLVIPATLPTVPTSHLMDGAIKHHYGMLGTNVTPSAQLSADMLAFKGWCMAEIRLDRNGYAHVKTSTWEVHKDTISKYLGYRHHYLDVPANELSMHDVLLPHDVLLWVHWVIKKSRANTPGAGGGTGVKKDVSSLIKIVEWLASGAATCPTAVSMADLEMWKHRLCTLRIQLEGCLLPVATKEQRLEKLPPAEEVLLWQQSVVQKASAMQLAHYNDSSSVSAVELALAKERALLFMWLFGHVPCPRLACIRTCVVPEHCAMPGSCNDADCKDRAHCKGNRLEVSGAQLVAVFAHYKTDGAHGTRTFQLPADLNKATLEFLTHHWGVLHRCDGARVLFPTGSGAAMQDAHLTTRWANLLMKEDGKPVFPEFPPSQLRHLLDTKVLPGMCDAAGGASTSAAAAVARGTAMLMGHTVATQSAHYDLGRADREMAAAIASMTAWRDQVLSAGRH